MTLDEEGTHARVKRYRRELVEPAIIEHHGRLIKTTGDGFLAMFDSPVEAVRCAIVIQQSMVGRNASLPREQWILYRLGVHLGDVIIETEDIYGDGVNIAARLEGIANPGDLFISGGVYEQVKNKLVCGYQSLGDRQVKNITDAVTVYRVLPDPAAVVRARKLPLPVGMLAALGVGAIAGVTGWYFLQPGAQPLVRAPAPPVEAPKAAAPLPAAPATQQAAAPARPQPPPPPAPAPVPAPVTTPSPAASPPAAPAPVAAPAAPPIATTPTAPVAVSIAPAMISLPGGTFSMGSNDDASEKPIRRVTIKPFAISKLP